MTVVLIGIDNGDASTRAVQFVLQVTDPADTELCLVHVIHWSPFSFNTPEENDERHRRREREIEAADVQVVQPMLHLVETAGRHAKTEIRHGNPSETLLDLAEQYQAAHVVVGRTGDSGLRQAIFGSVASRLVHHATIPVTVVP